VNDGLGGLAVFPSSHESVTLQQSLSIVLVHIDCIFVQSTETVVESVARDSEAEIYSTWIDQLPEAVLTNEPW